MGIDQRVAAQVEGAHGAVVGQRRDLAAGDVDGEQAVLADVVRIDDQRLAVGAPDAVCRPSGPSSRPAVRFLPVATSISMIW